MSGPTLIYAGQKGRFTVNAIGRLKGIVTKLAQFFVVVIVLLALPIITVSVYEKCVPTISIGGVVAIFVMQWEVSAVAALLSGFTIIKVKSRDHRVGTIGIILCLSAMAGFFLLLVRSEGGLMYDLLRSWLHAIWDSFDQPER